MRSRLQQLVQRANSLERSIFARVVERNQLQASLGEANTQLNYYTSREESIVRVQKFFQSLGSQEQVRLRRWMEQIVTFGLQSVFGEEYAFAISEPEIKGNEVVTAFKITYTVEDQTLELDPYDEMGGGPVDVLSFLLQYLLVYLLRDRIQPVLFLDESFKHLSIIKGLAERMADLLRELVDRTGVQIVMVTHNAVYQKSADVVYQFSKDRFSTVVDKL